jgi:hypothetical protein
MSAEAVLIAFTCSREGNFAFFIAAAPVFPPDRKDLISSSFNKAFTPL